MKQNTSPTGYCQTSVFHPDQTQSPQMGRWRRKKAKPRSRCSPARATGPIPSSTIDEGRGGGVIHTDLIGDTGGRERGGGLLHPKITARISVDVLKMLFFCASEQSMGMPACATDVPTLYNDINQSISRTLRAFCPSHPPVINDALTLESPNKISHVIRIMSSFCLTKLAYRTPSVRTIETTNA